MHISKIYALILTFGFMLVACQSKEPPVTEPAPEPETAQMQPTPTAEQPQPAVPLYPPAPQLPDTPDTLKIAVISDINGSYGTVGYSPTVKAAVQDIITKGYDFVVSPGDLVAGQKQGLDYAAMWKAFHYEIDDVFFDNNLEFIFAPGNHDASIYPSHAVERIAYARAFETRHPKAPLIEGSHFPFYYGVNIRNVRVIALDITRSLAKDDPQIDWLESVLSSPEKPRATLVLGHLPLAPVNYAQFWEVAGSQRLLNMLQKTPNTIYISGHHHIFYSGHIGELRTVAAPALGAGPRSLLGAPPVGGYVQIVLPPNGPAEVTALVSPDFKRMIDIQSLPRRIVNTEREDVGIAEYILEKMDESGKTADADWR